MTATTTRVREALAWLERRGSKRVREDMVSRYGIVTPRAFGVPMRLIQELGKRLGRDHGLAAALWDTGWYEARTLAAYVDEPERVTATQMDRWAREFDNWAICDTLCFCLFDRTPHAWRKVDQWSRRREEFVKRSAFALLASLALHDKRTGDAPFLRSLALIEGAAADERNFVKKGVSWALRSIGRRSPALSDAAEKTARRLVESSERTARWVGREGLRDLTKWKKRQRGAKRTEAPRGSPTRP
ncbi:MAG: DNA alkylation repair protein [Gemmatimonadales bacterium]